MTNYCKSLFDKQLQSTVLNSAFGSKKARIKMIGTLRLPDKMPGGGTGMLVVSLWVVNSRYWSHLGCLGRKVTIFGHSGIVKGYT